MIVEMKSTNHVFIKQNLVTIHDGKRTYDKYVCEKCGLAGKSFMLGHITFDGRISSKKIQNCPMQKAVTKIRIVQCNAVGKVFSNLIPGSVHEVLPPPDGQNNDRGVWVMGVGEPVKVLFNEFEEVK